MQVEPARHLGRVAARPIEPGSTLGEASPHHGTVGTSSSSPAATRNAVSASMIAARWAAGTLAMIAAISRRRLRVTSRTSARPSSVSTIVTSRRLPGPTDRSASPLRTSRSHSRVAVDGWIRSSLASYTDVQPVIVTVEYDECAELRECDGFVDRRNRPRRHRHQRPRGEQDRIGDSIQLLGLRRRPHAAHVHTTTVSYSKCPRPWPATTRCPVAVVAYCRFMDEGDAQPLTIVAAGRSLSLIGEVDRGSSDQLMRALTRVTDGDLWIDLSGVCYIDEAGLGVLISETRGRSTRGTTMFVINPSDTVRRLFETRGLLEFLHVNDGAADEPEAARQDLGREPDASGRSLRSGLRRWMPRRN